MTMSGSRMLSIVRDVDVPQHRRAVQDFIRPRVQGIIVRPMGRTHYCPTDSVHYTWDVANEPLLTIADGDTVVFETRDVSDNQIGPGSDSSVIAEHRLGPRLPAGRPGLRRGRRAGRHARGRDRRPAHARLGLDRDPARASACWPTTSPSRTCASSTSPWATARSSARTSSSRCRRSWARWASAPRAPARVPVMPPVARSAATSTPASSSRARRCSCRSASRARCSPPATPTAARATARSASRAWRPRCTPSCASRSRRAARSRRPSTAPPPAR